MEDGRGGKSSHCEGKAGFHKFRVEKSGGRPYRTRSYLRAARLGKSGGAEAGCPPVFLSGRSARNMLLV
jgi:hypothetical protein